MSRFKELYTKEIKNALKAKYSYRNVNMIPKLSKIKVNCVSRDAVANSKVVESIVSDLTAITGQRPVIAKSKKSIASFKLRENQAIGACVTLRGEKMYEFLDRLISMALPRVRDFRGVSSKGFDKNGNYNLGLKEQIIFPEIDYDKIDKVRGLGIAIETTAKTDDEARELLSLFGMPFRK